MTVICGSSLIREKNNQEICQLINENKKNYLITQNKAGFSFFIKGVDEKSFRRFDFVYANAELVDGSSKVVATDIGKTDCVLGKENIGPALEREKVRELLLDEKEAENLGKEIFYQFFTTIVKWGIDKSDAQMTVEQFKEILSKTATPSDLRALDVKASNLFRQEVFGVNNFLQLAQRYHKLVIARTAESHFTFPVAKTKDDEMLQKNMTDILFKSTLQNEEIRSLLKEESSAILCEDDFYGKFRFYYNKGGKICVSNVIFDIESNEFIFSPDASQINIAVAGLMNSQEEAIKSNAVALKAKDIVSKFQTSASQFFDLNFSMIESQESNKGLNPAYAKVAKSRPSIKKEHSNTMDQDSLMYLIASSRPSSAQRPGSAIDRGRSKSPSTNDTEREHSRDSIAKLVADVNQASLASNLPNSSENIKKTTRRASDAKLRVVNDSENKIQEQEQNNNKSQDLQRRSSFSRAGRNSIYDSLRVEVPRNNATIRHVGESQTRDNVESKGRRARPGSALRKPVASVVDTAKSIVNGGQNFG